jgi:hypothetical protein
MATKPIYATTSHPILRTYRVAKPTRAALHEAQPAAVADDERRIATKGGFLARLSAYREQRGNAGFDLLHIG